MKKRYKIPLIIITVLFVIFLICVAVKLIFPLQPNVGFHFEESETVLIDQSSNLYMDSRINTFWWDLIDERYAVFEAGDSVIKMDIETGEITAQAPLAREEETMGIKHRDNGNILAHVIVSDTDGNTTDRIIREYTPDLIFIRDIPSPEEFYFPESVFVDGVFYYATHDPDANTAKIYTFDENLNMLTSEDVDKSFMVAHSLASPTTRLSADGKLFIHWFVNSTDPDDPKRRKELSGRIDDDKFYITSFEAAPTTVIELPQKDSFDSYSVGAATGQDEYPIYVYYFNQGETWLDVVFGENLRGEAVMGVKWDGTTEKIAVTDVTLDASAYLMFLGRGIVRDEIIYDLEGAYEYSGSGPRLILRKYAKVYD
jgi:hypothetical protein